MIKYVILHDDVSGKFFVAHSARPTSWRYHRSWFGAALELVALKYFGGCGWMARDRNMRFRYIRLVRRFGGWRAHDGNLRFPSDAHREKFEKARKDICDEWDARLEQRGPPEAKSQLDALRAAGADILSQD